MKISTLSMCAVNGLIALVGSAALADATPGRAVIPSRHREFLESNCRRCHDADTQEGSTRLDDLPFDITDVRTAERWQKILDALNSGEMPPQNEPQPDPQAKADFLDGLAHMMVAARRSLADQNGRIAMRRLNRREYKNTLRSLLGVDASVGDLPADTDTGAFDTVGANLFMSSNQFELYEKIGREAIEEAFGLTIHEGFSDTFRYQVEATLPTIYRYHLDKADRYERAVRWKAAVDAAIARPENSAIVAELKAVSNGNEWTVRRDWRRIAGAPAPESYGFVSDENNADKAREAFMDYTDAPYVYMARYFELPHLDTGAYLTVNQQWHGNSWLSMRQPFDFQYGSFLFRVRAGLTGKGSPERRFIEFGLYPSYGAVLSTHEVTGTIGEPCVIEIPITLTRANEDRNTNQPFIREKGTGDTYEQGHAKFNAARRENGLGPEPAIWVDWIELERLPRAPSGAPPGMLALAGLPLEDRLPPPAIDAVRRGLSAFAMAAFRGRQPSDAYLDGLVRLYEQARAAGVPHATVLKDVLAVVLASPLFLYQAEPTPGDARRDLTSLELASRLSYFLWGGPPDQQLLDLAETDDLLQRSVLASQAHRMLDDPRCRDFVQGFASQWLAMDRLDFFQFNQKLYPHFDNSAKMAVRAEVYETLAHLVRENGSLRDLLMADYVVVNAQLADYYGLDGVVGDSFRKVSLPPGSPRGGLLGMAAIHAMGSNGEHTSPVERGAWVLRKLLNDPPPPPPANVPAITRLAKKSLTTRERLALHQEAPQCASCHRKIDPIGLAMENFDAVGRWRTEDSYEAKDDAGKPLPDGRQTWTIEPAGSFHGGTSFADFQEMRSAIALRHEDFARGFAAALIEYALGRPCGFSDADLVERIVVRASSKDYGVREFVLALVDSQAFHTK